VTKCCSRQPQVRDFLILSSWPALAKWPNRKFVRCAFLVLIGAIVLAVRLGSRAEIPVHLIYVLFHRKRTGQHHWNVSLPSRWTDNFVDTIFNIFTFLAWPVMPTVKFLGSGLLCFWHRFDQQRERLVEA
jgi:hypothetical protein